MITAAGILVDIIIDTLIDIATNPNPECAATCGGPMGSTQNASTTQFIYE